MLTIYFFTVPQHATSENKVLIHSDVPGADLALILASNMKTESRRDWKTLISERRILFPTLGKELEEWLDTFAKTIEEPAVE